MAFVTPLPWAILLVLVAQDNNSKIQEDFEARVVSLRKANALSFDCKASFMGFRQTVQIILKRPNLARLETAKSEFISIYDGKTHWTFSTQLKTFSREDQKELSLARCEGGLLQMLFVADDIKVSFRDAKSFALTSEKIDGETCDVFSWTQAGEEMQLWIDHDQSWRRFTHKVKFGKRSLEQKFEYSNIKTAPEIKDDTFLYTPPKDAVEMPGAETFLLKVGAEAPDIEGLDVEGKSVKISDYKGKIVVLNFSSLGWHTCVEEYPRWQKLCETYQSRGVVFLVIDLGDNPKSLQRYFEKNKYEFKPVFQKETEINKAFGVEAFGTWYVIGQDSKIVARNIGLDETTLQATLDKLVPNKR